MMSDWKVDLVNDNISELNVEFKGPPDSEYQAIQYLPKAPHQTMDLCPSMYRSILRGSLEGACGAARGLSIQVTFNRILQQNIPPKRG